MCGTLDGRSFGWLMGPTCDQTSQVLKSGISLFTVCPVDIHPGMLTGWTGCWPPRSTSCSVPGRYHGRDVDRVQWDLKPNSWGVLQNSLCIRSTSWPWCRPGTHKIWPSEKLQVSANPCVFLCSRSTETGSGRLGTRKLQNSKFYGISLFQSIFIQFLPNSPPNITKAFKTYKTLLYSIPPSIYPGHWSSKWRNPSINGLFPWKQAQEKI